MTATLLSFYLFSTVILLSSLMVISSKNPVHSVLFLILTFFNTAGLFVILHAEFLAMILIIVYVGAVAVLFLFVVMMLDIKTIYLAKDSLKYFPFGSFLGFVFLIEILVVVPSVFESANPYTTHFLSNYHSDWFNKLDYFTEIVSIGHLLYTDYVIQFLLSGNILLLATIGPVTLVLARSIESTKSQVTFKQLSRTYSSVLSV